MIPQRISFQPAVADWVQVYRFHYWRSILTRKMLLLKIAIAVAIIPLGVPSRRGGGEHYFGDLLAALTDKGFWITWLSLAAFLIVGLPLIRLALIPMYARRFFAQQKNLHTPNDVSWDHEGIIVEAGESRNVIPFGNLRHWRESNQAFLLYQTDTMFNFVMKRAFVSPDQLASFRADLTSHGVAQAW